VHILSLGGAFEFSGIYDQAVTLHSLAHNVLRIPRIDFDLLPEIPDIELQVIPAVGVFWSPDTPQQRIVADRAPGILDERGEQFELGGSQGDDLIVDLTSWVS
jgi:hypothetical protein